MAQDNLRLLPDPKPRRKSGLRAPARAARVISTLAKNVAARIPPEYAGIVSRASGYGFLGYLAYQGLGGYIERKNKAQDAASTAILKSGDIAANQIYRAALARRAAQEKDAKIFCEVTGTCPPAGYIAAGTGPGSYTRRIHENLQSGKLFLPQYPAIAVAGSGKTPIPPRRPGHEFIIRGVPKPTQRQLGVQKVGYAQKVAAASSKFFSSQLGRIVGGAALIAALSGGGKSKAKSAPEDLFDVPLTDFQSDSALLSGELGGVPVFDEATAEDAAPGKCEKVEPKRSVGECRQGWFSETPTKLLLKEWSRRPCQ